MIKRILIITAIGFAFVCAGWADGGWGANEEGGGGGAVCINGQWQSWYNGSWHPIGAPCG